MQDVKQLLNQIDENLNILERIIDNKSVKDNVNQNMLDENTAVKIGNYLNELDEIIERLDENNQD
tara:strand:+ start:482 stop:676 length:195 start_codon:yes stop_codon:yes gene_type:complete